MGQEAHEGSVAIWAIELQEVGLDWLCRWAPFEMAVSRALGGGLGHGCVEAFEVRLQERRWHQRCEP